MINAVLERTNKVKRANKKKKNMIDKINDKSLRHLHQ